ncbi:polygalacturonase QRT3-like [Phoenix dactylifera]|uniref:Polygalacturonase QRT3-like n=1 Tax=Phoenix dactylifera TaxID=42345 RepID=A0A8B9AYK2_PHODC|nr:polygalacturonase QRT3-like [Phoenix dactylifera]
MDEGRGLVVCRGPAKLLSRMMVKRKGGGLLQHHLRVIGLMGLVGLFAVAGVDGGYPLVGGAAKLGLSSNPFRHREHAVRRMESLKASLTAVPSPSPSPPISSRSRVYHVTDYGADPTGKTDSSEAIGKAISDAFRDPSDRVLMAGVADLGGAEIHLGGGSYLISSPVTLPATGGGNLKIHSGSLRASDDFPTDRYLIELWASRSSGSDSTNGDSNGYKYEYITLSGLMLDSNFRGGGTAIENSLRTTIDDCYIVHFMSDGILVQSGHETYIRNSFIGQHITAGNDPGEKDFSGTGINLMGNDNAVTDVVIFSAAIGILVSGQANTLTGVHCYNKATGWGGTGIYLKSPGLTQTRIINCYLDYTSIVSEDPVQLHVSGSFFLGDANVVLKSVKGVINGVDIVDNIFSGGGNGVDIVQLDESNGKFGDVDQVIVQHNVVKGMTLRSTVAKASMDGNAKVWTVDFSPVLLLPDRIQHVQYTLLADSMFPNHALRNTSGNQVVIETEVAVAASVHVAVDQCVTSIG